MALQVILPHEFFKKGYLWLHKGNIYRCYWNQLTWPTIIAAHNLLHVYVLAGQHLSCDPAGEVALQVL